MVSWIADEAQSLSQYFLPFLGRIFLLASLCCLGDPESAALAGMVFASARRSAEVQYGNPSTGLRFLSLSGCCSVAAKA
jgi:hypothetical protein